MESIGLISAVVSALAGAALLLLMWGRPRVALVVWMLSLAVVPVWISVDLGATIPIYCVIALLAAAATISSSKFKPNKYDYYFVIFLAIALVAVLLGGSTWASWGQMFIRWGIAYGAARVIIAGTGIRFAFNIIAITFGLVGGLALAELIFHWHPFVSLETGSVESNIWHDIQSRGGVDRSEWAFGHSIALGASIVLALPIILRSSLAPVYKFVLFLLAIAGVASTGSRSALVGAVLTLALCAVYSMRYARMRMAVLTLIIPTTLAAAILLGPLLSVWARGGSSEEQSSADYRNYLYATYVPKFEWFGRYPQFDMTRANLSIDSEVVILGLSFGWLILVAALLPLILTTLRVISGRAVTAELAIVGQLPILATVAFITQYESLFFIVVAIAVHSAAERGERDERSQEMFRQNHSRRTASALGRPAEAPKPEMGRSGTALQLSNSVDG